MDLRCGNVIVSLLENLWIEKYHSSIFNYLTATFACIVPSNIGISNFICILNGAVPLLEEYVFPSLEEDALIVGSHRRICTKISIISFLYWDSLRNIWKGPPVPFHLFYSTMEGHFGVRELFSSRETI
jgi:hypothetical protein